MKKIAIVTMGVMLGPEKKGYTRFRFLANFLTKYGYQVDLITTSFQHWEKEQRDIEHFDKGSDAHYEVVFIEEPGYKKNLDLWRIRSHKVAAKNLMRYFEGHQDYDLIYCEIPPNDVALSALHAAQKMHVPFVADINDLWPEAMRMALDIPIVSRMLFGSFSRDARQVYKEADAFVATSQEYAARPFSERADKVPCAVVYVGSEMHIFDEGVARYGAWTDKGQNEFWVTYAGTLGASYDIKTLIKAADELAKRGYDDIVVKILGGGPTEEALKELAASLGGHVDFEGYVPYQKMAAYLRKSDIVVNSFVKKAPQSIVNKIGDYLASGHPMINTCSSAEFRAKVEEDGFGINIEAEDVAMLVAAIEELHDNPAVCQEMGLKARTVAEEQFDRPRSYRVIVELIGQLLEGR
jgi:glycosyltransferase involved in cell wall biosynthesis